MKKPLPAIPLEEYPKRWESVRGVMDAEGLDILIVYADDHITYGPAWARWLTNFTVHFEPICILFTRNGGPVMLVGPESPEYAEKFSSVKDVRVMAEFTHPDEDYPFCKIEKLADIVADYIDPASVKKAGVAGRDIIGYGLMRALEQALPVEWVNVDAALQKLRWVKTPAELEVISYAYEIAQAGLKAAINAVKPGAVEREIAAEAEYAMRKMGSEGMGIDTMVSTLKNSSPILCRTTLSRVQANDMVLLTMAPRYEGYHGAVGLPVMVGNPPDIAQKALHAAISAQRACAALMKEGGGCGAEAEARRIMEEAGYGRNFQYSGIHSIGVIEFEPPIFGPSSKEVMRENMVLSVDIPVFGGGWGGLRIEDGYLIQKEGAKRMTSIDYLVQK